MELKVTPEERFIENYAVYMGFYRHEREEGHKKALQKALADVPEIRRIKVNNFSSDNEPAKVRTRTRCS